ncbi:hypothetical protein, variant [Verruconis gallopava]|uniref:Amidase domain-containing protein n=1 Tax=Verruconis gallopava TaxID=253628 RepID=A0A0D1ZW43_9PEZI|nr:hypothetical protein, variant [Verruconis gallopava]KIV98702.1 hypothetical protein, variant [Verruconis gallopava]
MAAKNDKNWKVIAERKRSFRDNSIPEEWIIPPELLPAKETKDVHRFPYDSGLFSTQELVITDSSASEVAIKIAKGEWSAFEVTRALCKRAAIAQQLVNCLTEILFDSAMARAKELDEYYKREGKVIGPLHGVPISLKDQFNIKGVDSTIGYVSYIGKPARSDSTLVSQLINAGAIPYVKTNVPATLMMGESVNNIFGRTSHPYNRELTSGGSSGGESALLCFRGSLLGVGTDIGGSIRHPSSFTGLYALRPSQGRVSYMNVANTYVGQEAVRSSAGPMCHSVADIRLFMKTIIDQKPWLVDPEILPLPWREDEEKLPDKLCFGFAMGDGTVTPSPPLRRAMEITKEKLERAGHNIIEFIPHEHMEAVKLIHKMWSADAGEEFQRDTNASGEPLHPQLESWLGKTANVRKQTVSETWQTQHARTMLAQRWLDRWEKTKEISGTGRPIDGLIMPSTPFPAIQHDGGYPHHWGVLSPLLDLSTGVFPVTKVDLEKDVIPSSWKPISNLDQKLMEYCKLNPRSE